MSPEQAPDDEATCTNGAVAPRGQQPSEPPADDAAGAVTADSPDKATEHTDAVMSNTEAEAKAAQKRSDCVDKPAPTRTSEATTDGVSTAAAPSPASTSSPHLWESVTTALRNGCLLTLLASIGLFWWWRHTNVFSFKTMHLTTLAVLTVLLALIWLNGLKGDDSNRRLTVRLLLMAALGAMLTSQLKANRLEEIQTLMVVPHESSAQLTAGVSYTAALMADLTRRWLSENPRSDQSPKPSRPWLIAVAVLPVIMMLNTVTSPFAPLSFGQSVTVAAPAALPQMPSSVTGEVAWTLSTNAVEDIVAGAAGPVLIKQDGAYGISPEDGSITWSYRLPGTTVTNEVGEACGQYRPVVSPDRRHLALRFVARAKDRRATHLVVLDTTTGAVTFKRRSFNGESLQLTDSVVADGAQVLRLSDGQALWRINLPKKPKQGHRSRFDDTGIDAKLCRINGQGGHATLLVPAADHTDSLDLFSESGSKVGEVTGVVKDPWTGQSLVRGGWIALWDDPDAALSILKSQTIIQGSWTDGAPAHAVNVDALAGGNATPVPLGAVTGLNIGMTMRSGDLCLMGRRASEHFGVSHPLREQLVNVASVLRADTGQVHPGSQDPGLAAASLTLEKLEDGAGTNGRLHLLPGDGSPGTTIEMTKTTSTSIPDKSMPPDYDIGGWDSEWLRALNAPGAVLVVAKVGDSILENSTIYRIYAIRSK